MYDARAVPLKLRTIRVTRLRIFSPARLARFLRERSEQSTLSCLHLLACFPAVLHSRHYLSDVDLDEGVFSPCCKRRCALRASSLTTSKSKIASSIAVNVSHAQVSQNKMNQPGCSRGVSATCKNVLPENNRTSAATSSSNMVLRRVLWSRMTPRVACTMNETVRRGLSSGELFVIPFASTRTCSILVDLTTRNFKYGHVQKSSQKKSADAGTFDATWFCLRAATRDWRRGQQQSFRFAGKRTENGHAGQ